MALTLRRLLQMTVAMALLLVSPAGLVASSAPLSSPALELAPRCAVAPSGILQQYSGSMGSGHDCSGYPEEPCG